MSSPSHLALSHRACEACHCSDRLLRCSGCHAVYYCGQEHQASDRESNKRVCMAIKRARNYFEREEQKLRDLPGDMFTPPNVFESGVGHFWGISETRPYMRARFGLVDALLRNLGSAGGRFDVVQDALDHLLDMLRLCRSDNVGVRGLIPALYIRLGRDQAAYDFMKWYATTGRDSQYDWADMDRPFLDVKGADVLESPERMWSNESWLDLSHSVAVALVKTRALLDLQTVQSAADASYGSLPQDIRGLVRDRPLGSIVEARSGTLIGGTDGIAHLVETFKDQLRQLCRSINQYNPNFWRFLLDEPAAAIATRPGTYSPGTQEEARLVLSYNFAAWVEVPRAIEVIRPLIQAP